MLQTTGMDDQDHLAVIGAALQSGQAMGARLGLSRVPAPSWMQNATPQGISTPAEELDYLPLDGVDFTNTGLATIDQEAQLVALPQRPFRGERIVLQALSIGPGGGTADALFRIVITPAMYVGAVQIGATQGQMPASAFGPGAFGVRLSFAVAGQGTRIYMPIIMYGINAAERIVVSGGIFGRAVR